jgi:prolipoprotein diacylglyceryltransferase
MLPTLTIPLGRALGAALVVLAGLLWALLARSPREDLRRGRWSAAAPLVAGLFLLAAGQVGTLRLPTYGVCMVAGTVTALVLAMRWAEQRGFTRELVLELALLGMVAGILGARIVYLVEAWDIMFADKRPARLSAGPLEPLARGDALVLRTRAGEATVRFEGDERDAAAAAARVEAQAGSIGLEAPLRTMEHRGPDGIERFTRGFVIRTREGGPDELLDIQAGPAARKLGLQPGLNRGAVTPLWKIFDLSQGGLTYFGAAIGVTLAWLWWLRRRGLPILAVLDAIFPVLPLGLFFGRLGCLSRGCCFGREAGPHAFLTVAYGPWSLPWLQMVAERLPCTFDGQLQDHVLTPAMAAQLPPGLVAGTPPLLCAQLYEGLGVLAITGLLLLFRRYLQRRAGQVVLLTFLLQAPLRFAVDQLRRDLDVFFPVAGLELTETQTVAVVIVALALPAFVWVSLRGAPVGPSSPEPALAAAGHEAA